MESIKKNLSSRQSITPLLAGFSGGVVSTTLLLPLDVIKVRLQVSESPRRRVEQQAGTVTATTQSRRLSAFQVCKSIIRYEGIGGLYQGLTPAVIGSAISWGGYFFLYEGFKKSLKERKRSKGEPTELHSLDNFVLAIAAGGCMVLLTNPVWLIKTRMQLQMKKSADAYGVKKPYNGMIDAARTIAREEGIFALYKGTLPAMALTSHGGVQFVVYEFLKKHLYYVRPKRDKSKSVMERLEKSLGFLTIGAISKMYVRCQFWVCVFYSSSWLTFYLFCFIKIVPRAQ